MSLKASPLPAWLPRFRPDRFTLLTIAIAGLGAALVLGHVAFGVMIGSDSLEYIQAARNLLAREGLMGIDGDSPYTDWPPLYPLLLAAVSLGIFDPFNVAAPLNVVIFALTVFAVGQYLRQRLTSRFLAAWGCLAIALAVPLSYWSSWAHSEPLFILLVTLALIQTDRFLIEGKLRALIWAAIFSALAWQTRYIGVAVPAFVGLILLFQPGISPGQRARRVTVYSLIVVVPMGLWLVLHNLLITEKLIQHPPPRDYPVSMIMLRSVFDILWSWTQTQTAAWLTPLVCMFVAVRWRHLKVADWHPFQLFGGFVLMYSILFIAAILLLVGIYLQGIVERYLVPLYIPLLISGVYALDRVLDHEREKMWLGSVGSLPIVRTIMPEKKGSALVAIVIIFLSLGVAGQAVLNVSTIVKKSQGELARWFNGPRWTGSETLRYTRENLVASRVYSNSIGPLALHIGGKEPTLRLRGLCNRLESLEQQMKRMPDGAYVVWFDGWKTNLFDYGEDDLWLFPSMELVARLEDGIVFKIAGGRQSPETFHLQRVQSPYGIDNKAGLNFKRYNSCPPPPRGLRVRDVYYADLSWEKAAPNFDYRSGDLGFVVDRSVLAQPRIQVFARNCAPDELLAWPWSNKEGSALTLHRWTINETGLCRTTVMRDPEWIRPFADDPSRLKEVKRVNNPAIRSVFNLYLVGNHLIYFKQPCRPDDNDALFFLHVFPADKRDLPGWRQKYGFDNLDFRMEEYRRCTAVRKLPDYPIAEARTGQFTAEGRLWGGTIVVADPGSNEEGGGRP